MAKRIRTQCIVFFLFFWSEPREPNYKSEHIVKINPTQNKGHCQVRTARNVVLDTLLSEKCVKSV